jgi:hypothetical protein
VRLYTTLTVDEYDHFEAEAVTDDEPPAHGVVRLREFSIQGDSSALRRLAAAAMNAADLADRAATP